MKAFVILSCAAAVALAQHRPLKEAGHFHAITEPHLPRDPNVLLATQNFLNQFAELKALADAAPDPPPAPPALPQSRGISQSSHPPVFPALTASHPSLLPPLSPLPPLWPIPPQLLPLPVHVPRQFDVHGQIRTLLNQHRPKVVPTFAPAPPALSPTPAVAQPVPTFAPARPAPAVRFPNFSVLSSVGGHQRVTSTGPRISGTGFTPDVLAAQKNLAAAHQNILRQQAALAPTLF
ncbi:LOW QUALITY PROTEIN: uncharacterized protein LOC135105850 [Scylla paramamosain]|uniref:LOW QUALITY PROTEIN: uncharacterized protein LOC135105850 n=1 Tax=Scylla paramamosain TaxID=85552 RepID=UPI0030837B18